MTDADLAAVALLHEMAGWFEGHDGYTAEDLVSHFAPRILALTKGEHSPGQA